MKIFVFHGIVEELDDFDRFFHKNITISQFKKLINIFCSKYNILGADEFCLKWEKRKLSEQDILITFDDCYASAAGASKWLGKLNIPAIYFISSDLVNNNRSWTDDIEKALLNTSKKGIKFVDQEYDISAKRDCWRLIVNLKKYFLQIPNHFIEKKLKDLCKECEVDPVKITQEKYEIISWKQVKELNTSNLFTIAHHSHFHFPLVNYSRPEEVELDIKTNIKTLKKKLGIEPIFFAHPFGGVNSSNEKIKAILKQCGFQYAFNTDNKEFNYNDKLSLPRMIIKNTDI